MRKITHIVLHCSATREGKHYTVADIDRWHRERGFRKIGYHYVIYLDGSVHKGRELGEAGAHVAGNNSRTVGICYIGGLDASGRAADTRKPEQKASMFALVQRLREMYPKAEICGHRDFSPDLNGDGIIEPWEFVKDCPCFDAGAEYRSL